MNENTAIWDYFYKEGPDRQIMLANHHGISGYLADKKRVHNSDIYLSTRKKQWLINDCYQKVINDIQLNIKEKKISVVLLKGFSLIGTIYLEGGERFVSDLDLYIKKKDSEQFAQVMESLGFKLLSKGSWEGDDYKSIYHRFEGTLELIIEVHTKLLFSEPLHFKWRTESHPSGLLMLDRNHLFLHLVSHYAFQHTFLKMYWGLDIINLLTTYQEEMDFEYIFTKAKELNILTATKMCLYVALKYFAVPMKIETKNLFNLKRFAFWKLFLTPRFLWSDRQFGFSYFYLKHRVKDSLLLAFKYDYLWFLKRLRK